MSVCLEAGQVQMKRSHCNMFSLCLNIGFKGRDFISHVHLVPDVNFDIRNEIPILINIYLDIHESISECNLYKCTWLTSSVSLKQPLDARYLFWDLKLNPDSEKPIFWPPWKHITVWPLHLYIAGLQYQPPAAFMCQILFLPWQMKFWP